MIRLNPQSECATGAVRFYIAQHMPDLLRRETRNVGVIVQRGDEVAARFIGESHPGAEIDGRSLKNFSDPKLYRLWVNHWKKAIRKQDWKSRLLEDDRKTYSFIAGGEVTDTGNDAIEEICNYLFYVLVSEGGLKKALEFAEDRQDFEDAEVHPIKREIKDELQALKIMKSNAGNDVRHPVIENLAAIGASNIGHDLSFAQVAEGGAMWTFEPLNLGSPQKKLVKQRAGYIANVFGDLRNAAELKKQYFETAVVVSFDAADEKQDVVQYALAVVKPHASIVNWNSQQERQDFLRRRIEIAYAA